MIVDGVLVALAYFLAFWLRFEGHLSGLNTRYGALLHDTIAWVAVGTVIVLALFGSYQRLWNYVGQRDYLAVVKGVVVSTVLAAGVIALLHPVNYAAREWEPVFHVHGGTPALVGHHLVAVGPAAPVELPSSVIVLFLLLALALLVFVRFVVHLAFEGRIRSFRVAKGARDVLIVGGGDGGRLVARELIRNPELRLRPVGFVDDDPRKFRVKDEYGLRVLGTTEASRPRPCAGRGRARRGRDRDPVGARRAARPRRHRLSRAWHPGSDAADRL